MARSIRSARFPAAALKVLLETKPFPEPLWQAATSAALHIRIGNAPARSGQEEGLSLLREFLHCTEAFACGFCEVWSIREAIYLETELEYAEPDGTRARIPCSVIARTTHGVVHDLRIHLDPSPLPGFRRHTLH